MKFKFEEIVKIKASDKPGNTKFYDGQTGRVASYLGLVNGEHSYEVRIICYSTHYGHVELNCRESDLERA